MALEYTISYNANGGSGGPSLETKDPGQTITLSTAKPIRSGYTFVGWGLSAMSDTVAYNGGESYSADVSIALYAIWTPLRYTISYNVSGGIGVFPDQTKLYDIPLTLHTVSPIRNGYIFKGWSISSSSSTVSYEPGALYSSNISRTLWAVWEALQFDLKISNLRVSRCLSNGTLSDTGRYAKVTFDWANEAPGSFIITAMQRKSSGGAVTSSWSTTVSGSSGTSSSVGYGPTATSGFDPGFGFDIYVATSSRPQYAWVLLPPTNFLIDFMSSGCAIGKVCELNNYFDVAYYSRFRNPVTMNSTLNVTGRTTIGGILDANTSIIIGTPSSQSATLSMLGGQYLNISVPNGVMINGRIIEDLDEMAITVGIVTNQTNMNNTNIGGLSVRYQKYSSSGRYISYNSSTGWFIIRGLASGEMFDVWVSCNVLMVPQGSTGTKTLYINRGGSRAFTAEVYATTTADRQQLTIPRTYIGQLPTDTSGVAFTPSGWSANDVMAAGSTTSSYNATYLTVEARRLPTASG